MPGKLPRKAAVADMAQGLRVAVVAAAAALLPFSEAAAAANIPSAPKLAVAAVANTPSVPGVAAADIMPLTLPAEAAAITPPASNSADMARPSSGSKPGAGAPKGSRAAVQTG